MGEGEPTMTLTKIQLRPTDRRTRDALRAAHDDGRHGPDDAPLDVLEHWATCCADCHARWHYEIHHGL